MQPDLYSQYEAERLGELHTQWSDQYEKPCVIPFGDSADKVIEHCRKMGAIYYEDGPDDECFVVVLRRDIGPELWTEDTLRRSIANK